MKQNYFSKHNMKDGQIQGSFYPVGCPSKRINVIFLKIIFSVIFIYGNLCIPDKARAQQGLLGAKTITTANVILNEFTTLTANAASGATSITVAVSTLNAKARFSGNLGVGELVMIIQMQGASINTTDTMSSTWGAITSYNNAGLFEFDQVASVPNGTTINLVTGLKNSYTVTGNVQVVRVPRYTTFTINAGASVTTDAWNGSIGGIVAVEAESATTINGTINATGLGFRGGNLKQLDICCPYATGYAELYASVYDYYGAEKGEGIAGDSVVYMKLGGLYGRGAPANGGGGGNDHNTAGGGGSNGNNGVAYNGFGNPDTISDANWKTAWDLDGATPNFHTNVSSGGGRGGYAYASSNPSPLTTAPGNTSWGGDYRENVGGHGGRPLDNTGNRIFFGGGGGAGQANDGFGSAGANGGGIVYIISGGNATGSGAINANGDSAANSLGYDGSGAGGGGGSVVIFTSCSSISNISINATGGTGGSQVYSSKKKTQESEGPGGGGGGGYVSTTNANSLTINVNGGISGTTNSSAMPLFLVNGATNGATGLVTLNPSSPYSDMSIAGSPVIAVLPASPSYCAGQSVNLTASGGVSYSWSPSTGLSSTSGAAVIANPTTTTSYTVTGTNASGCSNTYNVTVTVNPIPTVSVLPASPSICAGNSVNLNASGANTYSWSPSSGLSSSTGASVTASPSVTSTYIVTGTSSAGCSNTSSVPVTVHAIPTISALPLTSTICNGVSVPLSASGGNIYTWSPSSGLSASTGASVSATPSSTTSYTVTGTDGNGCSNTASVVINVNPLPVVLINPATPVICNGTFVMLNASGASTYSWSPSSGLSASSGTTVTANPSTTSTYTITGTSGSGCSSTTSVTVTVLSALVITVSPATPAICTGKSTSLTAGGANTFTWSPSMGLSSTSGSTVTANPTSTATYKVVGSAGGCSDSTNVTVTVNSLPAINVLPMSPAICNGKSVPLNASGGNVYGWSPALGLSASTGAAVNANPTTTSTYIVTGTDGNGCSNTSSATVTVNQLPTVAVLPASPSICIGQLIGLTANGANTYSWSPSSGLSASTGASVNANPSATSSYIVTGTDVNGCSNTSSVTVTVNPLPSVTVDPASPAICAGQFVALDGKGANTYIWSPSSGLSSTTDIIVNANPTSTFTYTVTGTDENGCSSTASVTVTVNPLPAVSVFPLTPSICNGKSVSLTASGGSTYAWSPSNDLSATTGTTVTANPSSTSSYIVTGTDGNNCSNTANVTVTVNPLPAVSVLPLTPSICNGKSVPLTASGASTYSWSPSTGLSATTGASVTANPSSSSLYTVTGTDGNGCTNTAIASVTVNPLPAVSVLPLTPAICNGKSVPLTASGASTYSWSPSTGLSATTGTSVTANPSSTSSYIVTGTDGNNCSNTANVTVTVNPLPAVSVLPLTPSICNGKSVPLTASGGSTYIWSPSTGLSATTGTSVNANPLSTSSYTVTGTDGNGCTNTTNVSVTVNPLPAVSVLPLTPSICNGKSVLLTAGGGSTYSWSPSIGLSATTGTSVNANPSSSASYMVTGTDGNGCTNTASVSVTVNPLPAVSVLPLIPSICNGNSILLTASGGSTYIWSPSTGLSATTGTSVTANPSSSSLYTVTGTDGNGCTNTASTMVIVNPLPSVGVLPASPALCNGQSVSLTASGAITYSWSPSTGISATVGISVTANPAATSLYTVTGTDGNGCTNTSIVTVTVNQLPVILVNPSTPVICNGQSVSLTASGANTYSWSPSTGLSASAGNTVTANPASTSGYTVTGTDLNGCISTANLTVTVKSSLVITVTPPIPVICSGQSIPLNAGGANTYSWSPTNAGLSSGSGTTVTANPTSTTTYKVIGSAGGCSDSTSVTVTVNPLPPIAVLPQSPAICNGKSVPLTASGGSTYSWSPSIGLSAITGISVTANPSVTSSYTVTGTDVNGCANTSSTFVTVNPLPFIDVLPASPDICLGKNVSLTASGGNTYTWNSSPDLSALTGTSVTANPSSTSSYTVTGTDGNGCSNTSSVTVMVNPLPTVSVLPASPAICFGQSVPLSANGASTYSWSPSSGLSATTGTSVSANPVTSSSYIITGTDANGCTNTSSTTVTVNPLPSVTVLPSSPAICFGKSVSLSASGANTYSWNPSTGLSSSTGISVNANPSVTSSYLVTGTDSNSCTNSSTVTVTVNQLPVINAGPDLTICLYDSTQITISGDPAGSSYLWNPSSGLSCSNCKTPEAFPFSNTTYAVVVTDPSGCVGQDSVQVNVFSFNVTAGPDTAVCLGSPVRLEASGGTSYRWSPSAGLNDTLVANPLANVALSTTYTVTALSNGCTSVAEVGIIVFPEPVEPNINQSNDTLYCSYDPSYASYQWYFNDSTISNATQTYYYITKSGNYNVAVTDKNGCSISVGINVFITGLFQNDYSYNPVYIYPDPANDFVFVHAPAFQPNRGGEVSLLNVLGERVLLQSYEKDWSGRIDIKSLPAGVYFVQIMNGSGRWAGKLVKE